MSVADWLGITEAAQTALLILAFVLMLTPWLSGLTIGNMQFPKLDRRRRRAIVATGPVAMLLSLALVVPVSALRPRSTDLRLLAADVTHNGDIDIAMSNAGSADVLLRAIELEVVRASKVAARPALVTAATYRVPIDDLEVGERRRLVIRHLIGAGRTERLTISPEAPHVATARLSLIAADGTVLQTVVDLSDRSTFPEDRP
jgi:hypothetical protein